MIDENAVAGGILIVRVIAGVTMAAHGWQKFFSGGRIRGTGRWFDSIGMRPGKAHAMVAATTEVGAGLLLALGFLTQLAGAAFVALMLVAGWTVHRANGFFSVRSGWEYNLILAAIGLTVATAGPQRWSVDRLLGLDSMVSGMAGFVVAGVGGTLAGVGQLLLFYRPKARAGSS